MSKQKQSLPSQVFLGIEAGGTHTVALAVVQKLAAGAASGSSRRLETGPANLRLVSDRQLLGHFQQIARAMPRPVSVAIGMAGARTEADRQRIRRAAGRVWPQIPCYATNDLETALEAAEARSQQATAQARVLVLSGTGSCCYGRTHGGQAAKVGGWGHILGDKGSGYEIGLRALKAVVYYHDCGEWTSLGQGILRALQLNQPEELIGWVQTAGKKEIASLAIEVFKAAAHREKIASDILASAAASLAKDAAACARQLVPPRTPVQFVLAGSVLLKQPRFTKAVERELHKLWPKAAVSALKRESVWGAVVLARRWFEESRVKGPKPKETLTLNPSPIDPGARPSPGAATSEGQGSSEWTEGTRGSRAAAPKDGRTPSESEREAEERAVGQSLRLSPTEQRNPVSMNLDKLPLGEAIALMLEEDEKIPAAILGERTKIEKTIKLVAGALRRGGRLFYVGAGTSGRLGVLDASECPPTFRTPPEMVQAIIAGGQRAIWEAVEGAEDDSAAGAQAASHRGVGARDVIIGIAASGRTPFVWGALMEAKSRGAATVLLCFNPHFQVPRRSRPLLTIAPNVGPEILTGSTRLKAGTATKLILNMITTLAMVRLGKVQSNLMVDVKASNTKLRDRATRIVQELTGADYPTARAALEKANWKITPAYQRLAKIFSCKTSVAKR